MTQVLDKKKVDSKKKPKYDKATYLKWFTIMYRVRKFEEKTLLAYSQQKVRGFCHVYIGQEAIAAGLTTGITSDDKLVTAYRQHGVALARGMDIPIGTGIAFAEKYRGSKNLCVTMFGDGAARQGALYESFNMAMNWKIPVLYIVENNGYAMGTSVERTSNVKDIHTIGEAFDMPSEAIDGMDPEAVHEGLERAAKHIRSGKGPYFLEIKTYRYKGHSVSDPGKYRTKEELNDYKDRDPVKLTEEKIVKNKIATQKEIDKIKESILAEMDEAYKFADESEYPLGSELYDDNYVQENYPFLT